MLKNSQKIRNLCAAAQSLYSSQAKVLFNRNSGPVVCALHRRGKKDNPNLSTLFTPIAVKPTPDDINVGAELTGAINKPDLLKVLSKFYQTKEVKQLLSENGLDSKNIGTLNISTIFFWNFQITFNIKCMLAFVNIVWRHNLCQLKCI